MLEYEHLFCLHPGADGAHAQWEDLCVRSSEARKPAPQNAHKY